LLVGLAVAGAMAAFIVGTASADGRTLAGTFCTQNHTCMALTLDDGTTFNSSTRAPGATQPDVTLRPGTYWLTVSDNSNAHNFALRSCAGSDALCTADNPASDGGQTITPLCNSPLAGGACGTVTEIDQTVKLLLTHGTYRLYCEQRGHEAAGMYVDIAVGGVGQVG
jgi:hypothetical protein